MKTNHYRSLFLAGFGLLLSQAANAGLLVGFYSFNSGDLYPDGINPDVPTDGKYSGSYISSGQGQSTVYTSGGFDNSYLYGPSNSPLSVGTGQTSGDSGYISIVTARRAAGSIIITFDNTTDSPSNVTLNNLFFNAKILSGTPATDTVGVAYQEYAADGSPITGESGVLTPNYANVTKSLLSFNCPFTNGFVVGANDYLNITLTMGSGGDTVGVDNIALITAVPEPGSLCALGCVLASGFVLRRRSR